MNKLREDFEAALNSGTTFDCYAFLHDHAAEILAMVEDAERKEAVAWQRRDHHPPHPQLKTRLWSHWRDIGSCEFNEITSLKQDGTGRWKDIQIRPLYLSRNIIEVTETMVDNALNAKAGEWKVRNFISDESEAREIMRIAIESAMDITKLDLL